MPATLFAAECEELSEVRKRVKQHAKWLNGQPVCGA